MTKEAKQITIIVVGVALIAVILPFNLKKVRKAPAKGVDADQTSQVLSAMTAQEKRAGAIDYVMRGKTLSALPSKFVLDKQAQREKLPWRNDPFKKPSRGAVPQNENEFQSRNFVVSGIVMKQGVGMAVLNGDVVEIGDTVEGYKVKGVDEKGVVLEKEGKEFTIRLESQ